MFEGMTVFQQKKKKRRKIDAAVKTGFGRFSWKIATDRSVTGKCRGKEKKMKAKTGREPLYWFQSHSLHQCLDATGGGETDWGGDCLGVLNILRCRPCLLKSNVAVPDEWRAAGALLSTNTS